MGKPWWRVHGFYNRSLSPGGDDGEMVVNSDVGSLCHLSLSRHVAGPPAIWRVTLRWGFSFLRLVKKKTSSPWIPWNAAPNPERLIGVDVTISNESGGGEERVGDLWVEIVLDQPPAKSTHAKQSQESLDSNPPPRYVDAAAHPIVVKVLEETHEKTAPNCQISPRYTRSRIRVLFTGRRRDLVAGHSLDDHQPPGLRDVVFVCITNTASRAFSALRYFAGGSCCRLSFSPFPGGDDGEMVVNSDREVFVTVFSAPCCGATGNLAGDIGGGAFLFEISEEEDIFSMDPVERVPNLERLIGVDVTISNRSGGGEERVSDLWVEIVLDQFFIVGTEAVTRE
ncbi:hypothetical protein OIU84_012272 [Salix udensis]|uniref:Uncharacterized protein n=1 Tax=Salix udensis TaxID=889485 RepID=A0AAD6JH33_9ROSI|nr:hypothetical protein OIU84_012272 [Salix udensis]